MIASVYECSAWKFPSSEARGLLVDLDKEEEAALVDAGFECEARGRAVDPGEWFKMWVQTHVGETEFINDYVIEHVAHETIMNSLPKLPIQTRRPMRKKSGLE